MQIHFLCGRCGGVSGAAAGVRVERSVPRNGAETPAAAAACSDQHHRDASFALCCALATDDSADSPRMRFLRIHFSVFLTYIASFQVAFSEYIMSSS